MMLILIDRMQERLGVEGVGFSRRTVAERDGT